jgi:hypothetical protein
MQMCENLSVGHRFMFVDENFSRLHIHMKNADAEIEKLVHVLM